MNAFGGPKNALPLTNRGVELAEAWFCGAKITDRVTHDPDQIGPSGWGWDSHKAYKYSRPIRVGLKE